MVCQADLTRGRRRRECQRSKCPGSISHCPIPAEAAGLTQTTACKGTFNTVLQGDNFWPGRFHQAPQVSRDAPSRALCQRTIMTTAPMRVRSSS